MISAFQAKYYAHELTRRFPSDSNEKLAGALVDAQVDLNPHQVTYAPSDTLYWQHGSSTESDFIYVTTQSLTAEQLQALNDDVGSERSLLVLCSAFKGNADRFPNLTIKKIPRAVLSKCEWGHDDYSLNVENLPMAEREEEKPKSKKSKQPTLFDAGEE